MGEARMHSCFQKATHGQFLWYKCVYYTRIVYTKWRRAITHYTNKQLKMPQKHELNKFTMHICHKITSTMLPRIYCERFSYLKLSRTSGLGHVYVIKLTLNSGMHLLIPLYWSHRISTILIGSLKKSITDAEKIIICLISSCKQYLPRRMICFIRW